MKKLSLFAFSVLILIPVGAHNAFASPIGDLVNIEVIKPLGTDPPIVQELGVLVVTPGIETTIQFDDLTQSQDFTVNIEDGSIEIDNGPFVPFAADESYEIRISDIDWIDPTTGQEISGELDSLTCVSNITPRQLVANVDYIFETNPNQIRLIIAMGDIPDWSCTFTINHESSIIGGEIIPIESTSLLLAGTQSFSWMLPVVLSVLGIGLFITTRKSDNS